MVGLAQLVSASGCGPEGRGFESHISPHKNKKRQKPLFVFIERNFMMKNLTKCRKAFSLWHVLQCSSLLACIWAHAWLLNPISHPKKGGIHLRDSPPSNIFRRLNTAVLPPKKQNFLIFQGKNKLFALSDKSRT